MTGVQTCALPIWEEAWRAPEDDDLGGRYRRLEGCLRPGWEDGASPGPLLAATAACVRDGRAAADEEAAQRLAVRLVVPLGQIGRAHV